MIPLLGGPLVVLLAALTVVSMAAAIVVWQRTRGPALMRVGQRVLLLFLCQVSALALVAAVVNNYGYFYGSWSDLLGTSSRAGVVLAGAQRGHGAVSGLTAGVAAGGRTGTSQQMTPFDSTATGWSQRSEWSSRGRVVALRVDGPRSALSSPALVYLPPQYFRPAFRKVTFPAAVVMTGYPGNTLNLVDRMDYPGLLLHEIQTGRAGPMVLVMLRPTVAPPRDTECTDVPGGPQALTYLAQDVPRAIAHTLRVRPIGWGVVGDSTGGYCAVKIALTHSDTFSAAVSLSGYLHTIKDGTTGELWSHSAILRNLNSPMWLVAHQPQPPVALRLTMGSAEHGTSSVAETRRFAAMVRPPLTAQVVVGPGGHNFANWDAQLPSALDWISTKLAAPSPVRVVHR